MSSVTRAPLKLTSKLLATTGPDKAIADVLWESDEYVPDPEARRLEAERLCKARLLAYLQDENANLKRHCTILIEALHAQEADKRHRRVVQQRRKLKKVAWHNNHPHC